MPKHKDALAFWNHHKYTLPRLAKLAATYLVVQATSVAAERVFSTSGDILSAERSCLSLDAMIFLKKNASAGLLAKKSCKSRDASYQVHLFLIS